jgi:hypothetical protein
MKTIIKIIRYINFLEKERINSMIYSGSNYN